MKYKVKVGTLGFEQGIFSKGDIIEVTAERAALFDKLDVEVVPETAPVIIEAPAPIIEPVVTATVEPTPTPVVKKTVTKKTVEPPIIETKEAATNEAAPA